MVLNINKKNKYGLSRQILFAFLIGLLGCQIFLLPFSVQAFDKNPLGKSYIIKINHLGLEKNLFYLSSQVEKLFEFSQSPEFANVYRFYSTFSETDIKNKLSGQYSYLNANKAVQSQDFLTNDPGFTQNPTDIDKEWGLARSGFPGAWVKSTGSYDNVVAVIDTGIDATHEDLRSVRFVPGFDFVGNKSISGNVNSDQNGHGTLVAGILGATPNNNFGITGANWQITLMPVRVLDESGKGEISNVSQAIVWAVDHGAQFINLSFGGTGFGYDHALSAAITYAFNKGALVVAAAGNDSNQSGYNLDLEAVYPICEDNNSNMILGVAATDHNDLKPEFSNFGKNCIDITAPGKRILSTINYDPITKKNTPNSYAYASGTSLAVPFVVAEAALLKALNPKATNSEIRDRILSSSDPIDKLNLTQCKGFSCKNLLGAGRINAFSAVSKPILKGIKEGELVKTSNSNTVFQIFGGQKRPVSPFVFSQRFSQKPITVIHESDLNVYPDGSYATPEDGTLVKLENSPAVYATFGGKKLPITLEIFNQHGYKFSEIKTLSFSEIDSWVTGRLLAPKEGSLVKGKKGQTVFWTLEKVLHPINKHFYVQKGLAIFPLLILPDSDLALLAKGDPFIK